MGEVLQVYKTPDEDRHDKKGRGDGRVLDKLSPRLSGDFRFRFFHWFMNGERLNSRDVGSL